ncbi:MAG: MMPL family transporter [FCB group bacterium]|nr:MMPL family transporter [FCB group bacterium]
MATKMKTWLIEQALDHPWRVIIICILFTALLGLGLPYIVIDNDFMNMIPEDNPSLKVWNSVLDEFGSTERIFIAFGRKGESALKPETLAKGWDFVRAVERIPEVDEVFSIATMNRIDSDDGFMNVSDLQPERNLTPEQLTDLKAYLDKTPDMAVRIMSRQGDFLNVVVQPKVNGDDVAMTEQIMELGKKMLKGYDVHFGGQLYLTSRIPILIQTDIMRLMRFAILILVIIMLLNLRSFPAVGMALSVVILSLIGMLGFMGWVVHITGSNKFYFAVLNASMPIILLTIANGDGIHIITKFMREARKRQDVRDAIRSSMNTLMLPVLLTSLTTAVAFLSMIFTPINQFLGYGISMAFGISWAWLLSTIFLPSLLNLKKWDLEHVSLAEKSIFEGLVDHIGNQVVNHPKRVLSIGMVVVLLGACGLGHVKVEVNIASFFSKGTDIRDSIDFLDQEMTGTMDMEVKVDGDMKSPAVLKKMDALQTYLESKPVVRTTISIADIIKLMHRTVMDDDPAYEVIPDTRAKVNNLFTLYSMSGDPDDFSSLVDYDYSEGLITALLQNIPTSQMGPFIDGVNGFIHDLGTDDFKTTLTGMIIIFQEEMYLILRSAFISISVSIVMIFLITWVFFKRLLWGLLSVLPLSAAVILNFGFMGIAGIELSHVTALLSSIIIGVGVDFAIHYVSQYRHYVDKGVPAEEISRDVMGDTGYPIMLNALSNMGFGALMVSAFLPVRYIGGLMVFAMISTSIGTLTLLASATELLKGRLARKEQ